MTSSAVDRPYVVLNAAMTLDGKIASRTGRADISGDEDWKRVHNLRGDVDAILVGKNTVLIDDPRLTDRFQGKNPTRVVVDSRAETPADAKVLEVAEGAKTVVAVTDQASKERVQRLEEAGAHVVYSGSGPRVDLTELMAELGSMGVGKLLLEGGGTLNWSMFQEGLVDEVRVSVAPYILGGEEAVTLVEGEGFASMEDAIELSYLGSELVGRDLVARYEVAAPTRRV